MKDSVRKLLAVGPCVPLLAAALLAVGCRRSDKTPDVAQDSLLVTADTVQTVARPKDTTATGHARERGATTGITQMHPSSKPMTSNMPKPRMQPPRKITPPLVLPGRDSTRDTLHRD
jgi:hypothetical protein